MLISKNLITTTLLLSCISTVWAGSQFYGASLDKAKWRTSGNRLECRLRQNIPGYGSASFKQHALQTIEFSIAPNYSSRKSSQALLFINPPNWKRYANRTVLGRVPLSTNKEAIVVPEDWAIRISLELREGMEAVWSHADFADAKDVITAKVMPMTFEPAWRDFVVCTENLIDYSYSDVKYSTFYFNKKSMRLNRAERKKLDRLAEYVLLDTDYEFIKINSHTDSRGVRGKNLATSKRRANMIKNYLVKKGVNRNSFVINARGEKKPKYNNRTRLGRAKNRRIEISLVK
ncbi:MAG: OmpA family protein [Woeseiaceae bacterium]